MVTRGCFATYWFEVFVDVGATRAVVQLACACALLVLVSWALVLACFGSMRTRVGVFNAECDVVSHHHDDVFWIKAAGAHDLIRVGNVCLVAVVAIAARPGDEERPVRGCGLFR